MKVADQALEPHTYLPIADHGVIGDLQTAALVGVDGAIKWWCLPRFDSPSVFGALLDTRRGGTMQVRPAVDDWKASHSYEQDTCILVTRFRTDDGVLEVTDFMPRRHPGASASIYRRVRCVAGRLDVLLLHQPRFMYGTGVPALARRKNGIMATWEEETLALSTCPCVEWAIDNESGSATGTATVSEGQEFWVVLTADEDEVAPTAELSVETRLAETREFWHRWSEGLTYRGPYRDAVVRSALTLKLLCYEPSGAIVAAATTSLPEWVGGVRNWDYRYTWLRDASFTLNALQGLGQYEEASSFMRFVKRISRLPVDKIQIMYGVGGERRLPESILDHLEGYRGSSPVRIGNGAADQVQMDVYGELMDTVHIWSRRNHISEGLWLAIARHADTVAGSWQTPDHGIWEPRTGQQHFVFSRLMCWVALDRVIRIGQDGNQDGDYARWAAARDAIRTEILEKGWNEEKQSFVMHYGSEELDSALLLIPAVGFLPPNDPRVLSTIAAIERELAGPAPGLLYRYHAPDGVGGAEGIFLICGFWLADAYVLAGQVEKGRRIFEALLDLRGSLGLLAEELDPVNGELLGNYPQAYTHIALINTALLLDRADGQS